MRLVLISDTHNVMPVLPLGDVLVHAGDLTMSGGVKEMAAQLEWLGNQPHEYKVIIAGNHDWFAEEAGSLMGRWAQDKGIDYLNDSGVEINGIEFWGSPVQPWFHDWAFNRARGEEIRRHWDMIPENTDVLITHGPPAGIHDMTFRGESVGCVDLAFAIQRVMPKIHVFGHIHEAYGSTYLHGVDFYNASIMNLQYEPVNKPWEVEI